MLTIVAAPIEFLITNRRVLVTEFLPNEPKASWVNVIKDYQLLDNYLVYQNVWIGGHHFRTITSTIVRKLV